MVTAFMIFQPVATSGVSTAKSARMRHAPLAALLTVPRTSLRCVLAATTAAARSLHAQVTGHARTARKHARVAPGTLATTVPRVRLGTCV